MTFLFAAYTIYFHARWGQTLGKMAAGIRVIKASGSPIEWREALLRSSADTVFSMVLLVASMYALIRMPASQFTSLGWMAR